MAGLVGMEVPGSGEQRQARHPARPALGERDAERAAHAIAQHDRRPTCPLGDEGQRPFEACDIGRQVEAPFFGIGRAPIDQVRPQTFGCHGTQQALLRREVEHLPAIDQRWHHQHRARPALARSAMRGAIVEQAGVAFAPRCGRRVERALDGAAAIGQHALGETIQTPADLAMQGRFEPLGIERADLF